MAATDIEDEVFSRMGWLNLAELAAVYQGLGLPTITDPDEMVSHVVRKKIMKFLTSDDVENSDDQGAAHFLWVKGFMDQEDVKPPVSLLPVSAAVTSAAVSVTSGAVPLQPPVLTVGGVQSSASVSVQSPALSVGGVQTTPALSLPIPSVSVFGGTGVPSSGANNSFTAAANASITAALNATAAANRSVNLDPAALKRILKKDFKIKGTIGNPDAKGQQNMVKFSHLAYTINNAEKKGYPEEEICEEVIRAISNDIPLKGALEGKSDLTLAILRKFLRSHFQEKDSTTLFSVV